MLPTSRKKLQNPGPARLTLLFKSWIHPKLNWQKEGCFLKIGFFLISIIVFTSGKTSCKILFGLGEIVFFSIIVFFLLVETIIEIMQKSIFSFLGQWKTVFSIYQIFQAAETNFLSSRNSIVLFRALLKILKFGVATFLRETLSLLVKTDFFCQQKLFLMVEKDFLSCGNRSLLFIYLFFLLQAENFTEIKGNKFI